MFHRRTDVTPASILHSMLGLHMRLYIERVGLYNGRSDTYDGNGEKQPMVYTPLRVVYRGSCRTSFQFSGKGGIKDWQVV
jgi:hypothetical protein